MIQCDRFEGFNADWDSKDGGYGGVGILMGAGAESRGGLLG